MKNKFFDRIIRAICITTSTVVLLSSFSYAQASGVNVTVNGKKVTNTVEPSTDKKTDDKKTEEKKSDKTKEVKPTEDKTTADVARPENTEGTATGTQGAENATTTEAGSGESASGDKDEIIPFVNDINGDGQIIVVIDPGHGGKNTGSGWNDIPEKQFTLNVAHAMYDELMLYDNVTVYLTHDDLDVDYSLDYRADFANEKNADILISLHFNGTEEHIMYGTDVWVPITPSVNYQSYQMAELIEENLAGLGILVRGIKNFWRDNREYYGIIRHCTAYNIPSLIVEHCHFDNVNDNQFLDTDEKVADMGRADATAVAQYFGLSSIKKDITYSGGYAIPLDPEVIHGEADETKPVECKIEPNSYDPNTSEATINITAYDNESAMLYYSISKDGGNSFSDLKVWPGTDAIGRTSPRTITVSVGKVNADTAICVRAYNYFEQKRQSENIYFAKYINDSTARSELNNAARRVDPDETPQVGVSRARYDLTPKKLTPEPEIIIEPVTPEPEVKPAKSPIKVIVVVIIIIIVLIVLLFGILLFTEIQRRKRIRRKKLQSREQVNRRINRR